MAWLDFEKLINELGGHIGEKHDDNVELEYIKEQCITMISRFGSTRYLYFFRGEHEGGLYIQENDGMIQFLEAIQPKNTYEEF